MATTLFMHGHTPMGEIDGALWLADGTDEWVMKMDAVEPDGSTKSMGWRAESVMPWNDQCTGLPVGFPTWTGDLTGKIVGDMKVTVHSSGAGETVTARIWADIQPFAHCNDEYVPPAAEVDFETASGPVEVTFEDLDLEVTSHIMVEFLGGTGSTGRVQYDSADQNSGLEFGCLPPKGSKTCVPEAEE